MMLRFVYDIESYPNFFSFTGKSIAGELLSFFADEEVNQIPDLIFFLKMMRDAGAQMVGFNSLMYDYPVIHAIIVQRLRSAKEIFEFSDALIREQRQFPPLRDSEWLLPQIDLFRIHHFHNRNKGTSLKALEFNMRLPRRESLPYKPGSYLTKEQKTTLLEYNAYDVEATMKFYHESQKEIEFREELTRQTGRWYMNHDNARIGSDYFIQKLTDNGYRMYGMDRKLKQTSRPVLHLKDVIIPKFRFTTPEFQKVLDERMGQSITTTKHNDAKVRINGVEYVFGLGGLHAAYRNGYFVSNDGQVIVDLDVSSFYPNIAISNGFYPEHLGSLFPQLYKELYEERKKTPKGTFLNAAYKEALVSVFGKSNDKYSALYDPKFTMQITVNGQFILLSLVERMLSLGASLIQANTDGITFTISRSRLGEMEKNCLEWEAFFGLKLDAPMFYKVFCIRDVNNYIGKSENGKIKAVGVYKTERDWSEKHSQLVVAKVARLYLLEGRPIRETLQAWKDPLDFMILGKAPSNSTLIYDGKDIGRYCRYYVSKKGGCGLTKRMPPLVEGGPDRDISQCAGYKVTVLNDLPEKLSVKDMDIDFEYYATEVEKICFQIV